MNLDLIKVAAQARADGQTWDSISELPGMPTKRSLLRWAEEFPDLFTSMSDAQGLGLSTLRNLLTDSKTTPSVRAKVAADLQRIEILMAPDKGNGQPAITNISLGFDSPPSCPNCNCDSCTALREPKPRSTAPDSCLNAHLHSVVSGSGRDCGCPR